MYHNKLINNNQVRYLPLIDAKNDNKWQEKKIQSLFLAESYQRLENNKAIKVNDCGSVLIFKRNVNDFSDFRLSNSYFCKVRLCPMCIWRRSKKVFGQVSRIMDAACKDRDYEYLFLTLTARNVWGEDLMLAIDELLAGFKSLTKSKEFKKSVKGWFRALEVKHNIDKNSISYGTYNQHIHLILQVNKSYFVDNKQYISQDNWVKLWQKCLKVDYLPVVDIRKIKDKRKDKHKDKGEYAGMKKAVAETAKYTVLPDDYLIADDLELTDATVKILDTALTGRRLVAYGGNLRALHKKLNLDDPISGDLTHTGDEEIRNDLQYITERYCWNIGYSNFIRS